MEFKFRAVDERPPSFLSPSSTFSYQSWPASYSSFVPSTNTGQMDNPNYEHEAILRELEKEQIRREIIDSEIARRRMLEDEVRRELMLERELAMKRNMGEELSLEEKIAMRLSPSFSMMHPSNNLPFEERMELLGYSSMDMSPLPRLPQVMDKSIILDKLDPDCCGAKQKGLESPAVDGTEHSPFGLKKKSKDDWSCALCHICATSEKGLNEHLQGRKHKAKEALLRTLKIGKSTSTSLLSKKSEKSLKPAKSILITTSGLEAKADEQSLRSELALEGISKKVHDKDLVEITSKEQLVQGKQNAEASKKQNAEGLGVKKTNKLKRRKKAKFWCEVCQVGVPSQIVMERHKNGRKHKAQMLTFIKNKGSIPVLCMESSETIPLTNDTDAVNVLTKETNKKTVDNFANDEPSASLNTGQKGYVNDELKKEQIRHEIIASEIAQRSTLEDEVRRELMLERELAMQTNMGEELSLEKQIAMPLSPSFSMMHPLNNLPFEERMTFPSNSAMNMFTFLQLPQVMAFDIKPPPEINKDRLIILDKPDPDLYRAKLKALESYAVDRSEHSPFGLKKKPKDEWSCALCHVCATSEKVLNEHLGGRKHKAKEAALRSQKIGKSTSTSLLSNKSEKSVKPNETILISTSGLEAKADDKDFVEITNVEQVVQKNQNAKGLGVKKTVRLKKNKNVMSWCEVCQVQVPCRVVERHKSGRKHRARMLIYTKKKESVLVSSTVSSETTPSTEGAVNVLTIETNMKISDNFANSDKPLVSPVVECSGGEAAEEL